MILDYRVKPDNDKQKNEPLCSKRLVLLLQISTLN